MGHQWPKSFGIFLLIVQYAKSRYKSQFFPKNFNSYKYFEKSHIRFEIKSFLLSYFIVYFTIALVNLQYRAKRDLNYCFCDEAIWPLAEVIWGHNQVTRKNNSLFGKKIVLKSLGSEIKKKYLILSDFEVRTLLTPSKS